MLDKLLQYLEIVFTILKRLPEIREFAKKNPRVFTRIFISLLGFLFLYLALYYYANILPGQTITNYFKAVGSQMSRDAWILLSPQFRKRWKDEGEFQNAYSTSAHHENVKIHLIDSSYLIVPTLLKDSLRFRAEYEVTERFTKEDLRKKEQHINSLWVQIQHTKDYQKLMDGSLNSDSLALRRYYKTKIGLSWKPGEAIGEGSWVIESMNFTEQGLKPLRGFSEP